MTITYRTLPSVLSIPSIGIAKWKGLTQHGHNIGKYCSWTIILIGIDEDSKPFEVVLGSEYRAGVGALLGYPEGQTVTEKVAFTMNFEFNFDLNDRTNCGVNCEVRLRLD